jgi:hypothetical protein
MIELAPLVYAGHTWMIFTELHKQGQLRPSSSQGLTNCIMLGGTRTPDERNPVLSRARRHRSRIPLPLHAGYSLGVPFTAGAKPLGKADWEKLPSWLPLQHLNLSSSSIPQFHWSLERIPVSTIIAGTVAASLLSCWRLFC